MTTAEPIEVSVVLPCLNEAETLASCVQKAVKCLADLGVRGEVVVSDNGSTDGSQQIATDHGARVVAAPVRGYGGGGTARQPGGPRQVANPCGTPQPSNPS